MKKSLIQKSFIILITTFIFSCKNYNINTKSEALYSQSHEVFWNYNLDSVIFSTAKMPQYIIGDAFLYDDNSVEYVSDIIDNKYIKWQSSGGIEYITHQNIFLPIIKQTININDTQKLIIENIFNVKENFLWPPKIGLYDEIKVKEIRSDNNFVNQFNYIWSCKIIGTETIKNNTEKFDTFVTKCRKTRNSFAYETVILYYAPEIGRFARIIKKRRTASNKIYNVISYGLMPNFLSEDLQNKLTKLIQNTLETKLSNNSGFLKVDDIFLEITPLNSFKTDKDCFCREYQQKLFAKGKSSIQKGTACRDEKGIWKTPQTLQN